MAASKDTATALAENLLAKLKAQRSLGKEAYPLTLQRLVELADSQAPPELVAKAVGKKAFKDGAVLTGKSNPAALVALADDAEQLAGDPQLLLSALKALCTPANPLWPLAKVQAAIENSKLRKPFAAAVNRQISDNTLPHEVGVRMEKKKPLLFLKSIPAPPPPPPPRKPDEVLAEKLLRVLETQRQLGDGAYPLPLRRLVELTDAGAAPALQIKALAHPTIKGKLAFVDAKNPEAPVALAEDRNQLVSSGALLEFLLRKKRSETDQAFPADKLVPPKSELRQPLLEAVERRIQCQSLPPGIGWMWVGKKKVLFFLEDVHRSPQATKPIAGPTLRPALTAPAAPADFARAFDDAFNQIDRQKGAHNFVSLVDLRRALPLPPERFDAELRQLRIAGRYTLSAAEGRHGISPEERAAGIQEDGSLLLYVSRKTP
jgi:hypothetical protein